MGANSRLGAYSNKYGNYCFWFDKSHDERFLSAINVCISTVAPHFSCAKEPTFCYVLLVISLDGGVLENIFV